MKRMKKFIENMIHSVVVGQEFIPTSVFIIIVMIVCHYAIGIIGDISLFLITPYVKEVEQLKLFNDQSYMLGFVVSLFVGCAILAIFFVKNLMKWLHKSWVDSK